MSLPSRFTVLWGTTRISQLGATVFPDDRLMLSVLFILILLLLKQLNSPISVDLFSIFCPSLVICQFAVVCETKLLGLPVSTCQCKFHCPVWVSIQYSSI